MNNLSTTQKIRQDLKKAGYKAREISVRNRHGGYSSSANITIKNIKLDREKVEKIAQKQESIDRCEVSGEILSGGNTFIFVSYSDSCYDNDKARELIKKLIKTHNYVKCAADVRDANHRRYTNENRLSKLSICAEQYLINTYLNQNWNVINVFLKEAA